MIDAKLLRQIQQHERRLNKVEARRPRRVDVMTFAATADGVTDDAAAIQAGLDSFDDYGGGVLFMPKGDYLVNSPLAMRNGVHLSGEGEETVITVGYGATSTPFGTGSMPNGSDQLTMSSVAEAAQYQVGWSVDVTGMTVKKRITVIAGAVLTLSSVLTDPSIVAQPVARSTMGAAGGVLQNDSGTRMAIRDLRITGLTESNGITLRGSNQVLIENVRIIMAVTADANVAAIGVYANSTDLAADHITIRNCYIDTCHLGILVQGSAFYSVRDVTIEGCSITAPGMNFATGTELIKIDGGGLTGVQRVRVVHNSINNSSLGAISVEENAQDVVVANNTITPGAAGSIASYGLRIEDGQQALPVLDLIVSGNVITGGTTGIYVGELNSVRGGLFTGNLVSGMSGAGLAARGFDLTVSGNHVHGGNLYALGQRITMSGNHVYDAHLIGDQIVEGAILGNTVHNGIVSVLRCQYLTVGHNTVLDNPNTAGINISGATVGRSGDITVIGNVALDGRQVAGVSVDNLARNVNLIGNKVFGTESMYVVDGAAEPTTVFENRRRAIWRTSVPAGGSWRRGDLTWQLNTDEGDSIGWNCTISGTAGTLRPATTGAITNGLAALTVADTTFLNIGQSISIVGVTGNKIITAIDDDLLIVTINVVADATVAGAAVQVELTGTTTNGSPTVTVNNARTLRVGDYINIAGGWTGGVAILGISLTKTTGTITTGTASLVVASATGLAIGQTISVYRAGPVFTITNIVGTTITLDSNATATVTDAAVAVIGGERTLTMESNATGSVGPVNVAYVAPTWEVIDAAVGYRSDAGSPVGVYSPRYIGENYLDSTANVWYRAYGSGASNWTGYTASGAAAVVPFNIAGQSATAFTVARAGTNYALQVDTNTASSVTGLKLTAAAAAGGLALAVISSGADEALTLDAKGSGTVSIGTVSTGGITLGRATTVSGNLLATGANHSIGSAAAISTVIGLNIVGTVGAASGAARGLLVNTTLTQTSANTPFYFAIFNPGVTLDTANFSALTMGGTYYQGFGITLTGGAVTAAVASTLLVNAAATGATANYAVYVTAGASHFGGVVDIVATATQVAVLTLKSTATNDDPSEIVYQGRVATTGSTQTTINTIAIPATTTVMIVARVIARRTGGASGTAEDAAGYEIKATIANVAGTATIVGAVLADYTAESVAGYDATITVSGANALVRVTGVATTDVTWHSTVRVYAVGS